VFLALLKAKGLPQPVQEYRFHPTRQWRLDMAWPESKVALEVEGGIWTRGRHARGAGMMADMDKYSWAAVMGWCLIRRVPSNLCGEATFTLLQEAFACQQSRL